MEVAQTNVFVAVGSAVFLAAGISSGAAQTLDINVGFAATMKVERTIDTVTVRDPAIVRAEIAAGRVVVVFGRAAGVTDVIPRDHSGGEIAVIAVKVTPYQTISDLIDISYTIPTPSHHLFNEY